MKCIPEILESSIDQGVWRNPGADVLRRLFGSNLLDMELFQDSNVMRNVADDIESGGYVDDPGFCFTRESRSVQSKTDPRLVFEDMLFIAGSVFPGDDEFIAADLSDPGDPTLYVFDWDRAVPNRWVARGNLSNLIQELGKLE